jgi:hypothetical protein
MNKKCEVLIQISGKNPSSKHAELLTDYLINSIEESDEVEIITKINSDYNFNISIDSVEIFSKRNFWNKYPNYKTILNRVNKRLEEKRVYAAMKSAYQLENQRF